MLYVDDLDRCPPEKVLEVLEAVHLLLAFELFVVVVAVDTRWLRSALHESLPTLQQASKESDSMPTAMDYVEKICQIPFWVEELDDEGRRRLIRGLLLPTVSSQSTQVVGDGDALSVGQSEEELVNSMLTGFGSGLDLDARQLSLAPDELGFIESLARLVGGTPRRVKRFVNICQLLLAMTPPLPSEAEAQLTERMATCFIAALHEGCPRLANRLVDTYNELSATPSPTLRSTLNAVGPGELTADRRTSAAWLKVQQRRTGGLGPFDQAPMSTLASRFDMIRRLRFDPEPANTPFPPREAQQTDIVPGNDQ
ncbi:P-loop NTPase fold protein [Kribbella sp. NBC_00359]|uniref:P-loop NTPase fold protein n=1 Tax=Kribbella sp. NBC_00359 TaxID=2975966 RepID=UPI003FA5D984